MTTMKPDAKEKVGKVEVSIEQEVNIVSESPMKTASEDENTEEEAVGQEGDEEKENETE